MPGYAQMAVRYSPRDSHRTGVLWRSEAGLPLPDHRPPGAWVGDIAARLGDLSISIG